jgi:hypothetical protein
VTRADNDFAPASSSSSSSEEAVPEPEPEPAAAAAAAASVKSSTPSTPSKPKKPQQASPPAKPVVAKPSAPIVAVRKPQREFETAPIVAAVAKPTPVVVAVPQPSVPVVASSCICGGCSDRADRPATTCTPPQADERFEEANANRYDCTQRCCDRIDNNVDDGCSGDDNHDCRRRRHCVDDGIGDCREQRV